MKIDINKEYKTRDGQDVEIVKIYSDGWPIVGYIGNKGDRNLWSSKGKNTRGESNLDLVEVIETATPPKSRKRDKCKWDNRFLELAEFYSKWSKDPSTQVGCVIVDNNNIVLGLGYNGFPRGVSDSNERIKDRSIKHLIVQHAEVNAVLNSNSKVNGATAYVTHPPCSSCTGLLIQAGIKRIVTYKASSTLAKRYNASFKASLVMLKESGVEMTNLECKESK